MIYLLGGYMWLYVHRPFEVWPSLGVLQLERAYMLVMLLAWLIRPDKGLAANRIHAAIAFFAAALGAAWVLSPYSGKPGTWEVVDNYAKVCVFYFLVVTTVRDDKSLRLLVLLFMIANALYMNHSVLEFLNGRYQWRMGIRRMVGVDVSFGDPNAFASTLLYTLPIVIPFWRETPRRVPRYLMVLYVLGVLGSILLTGSRAAFAGLGVLSLYLVFLYSKNKFQTCAMVGMVGLIGLVVLTAVLPEELQNRYLTLVDSTRGPKNAAESASGRMDGFVHGIEAWQRSPLVGHGPASFAFATGREGQAHNVYGQVLSEMGAMGGFAFFVILVCFRLNCVEARRLADEVGAPPNDFCRLLSQSIGINILLLLIMGWAGHNLFRYNWQWFAAFSGVAVHCLRARKLAGETAVAPESGYAPEARPALGYYT